MQNSSFTRTKKKNNKSVLSEVADKLRNKELFPEKIERAKKFFSQLKHFPA